MNPEEIDLHLLDQKYAHTRIREGKSIFKMMQALERFGQTVPVTVVPDASRFVLIDGYCRVQALKKMGKDTVLACVWNMPEQAALLSILAKHQKRPFDALEQASLIKELHGSFQLSLSDIGKALSKNRSWVKRRLDLLESLPADVLDLVQKGQISTWAASRVLVPLARANKDHAERLSQYLASESMSTRELVCFAQKYDQATRQVREQMIEDPGLFQKVKEHTEAHLGPEDSWVRDMKLICAVLNRLVPKTEAIFATPRDKTHRRLQDLLAEASNLMADMAQRAHKGMEYDLKRSTRDHQTDAPQTNQHQADLRPAGDKPEYRPQGPEQPGRATSQKVKERRASQPRL